MSLQNIVFLEGKNSGLDWELYHHIANHLPHPIKFVASGSSATLERLNHITAQLLGDIFPEYRFWAIRDRDYLYQETLENAKKRLQNTTFILPCHEVENLVLEPLAVSKAIEKCNMGKITSGTIRKDLWNIAKNMSYNVVCDMFVYHMNHQFLTLDYSIENPTVSIDLFKDDKKQRTLRNKLFATVSEVHENIQDFTNPKMASEIFENILEEVQQWLGKNYHDKELWLWYFPGKEILKRLWKHYEIPPQKHPWLTTSLVEIALENPSMPLSQTIDWLHQLSENHCKKQPWK